MAVFRIEKTRDYTVMSNYHLRDRSLSLKAKGLLSLMLSLPEDWDYTMKGLARICKDGIDSSSGGIRELEAHGYLVRARVRGANGQLGSIEYTILEQPKEPAQTPAPVREKPIRENPVQANPMLDAPIQENHAQLNKEESSNYPSRTDLSNTKISSPSPPHFFGRSLVTSFFLPLLKITADFFQLVSTEPNIIALLHLITTDQSLDAAGEVIVEFFEPLIAEAELLMQLPQNQSVDLSDMLSIVLCELSLYLHVHSLFLGSGHHGSEHSFSGFLYFHERALL